MKENKNYIYWLVVIAGCGMIGTCLGLGVNVAGLFFSPIAKDFNVGRGSVSATLMVYNLIQAFTGLAAPASLRRFGLKKMVIFGTVIQAVTTFLLSVSPNVLVLMILNGIRGFASGLIGTVTVTVMINYWFNKNNGLMTSIAMGFSGLAAALLSPILSGIIANAGWRTGYMVLALITVLFNLPAILFPIALKPDYKYMEPHGGRKEASSEGTGSQSDLSISVVMLVILMVYTGCSAAAAALPQHFSGIAESYGMLQTGALMVSACMISNTAGKILLGTLIDRFGAKLSISIYAAVIVCGALLIVISRSSVILIAAATMYGLCYSMGTVSTAMLTREMFGPAKYSRVYPKLAMATTISNAVFTTVVGMLYDMSGTYSTVILFLGCLIVLAFCMVQLAYARKAKMAS
ncbi:MAG: MFS transporter [Solobacterium sp.]|nr:MFS transporter [Solobacterium sp.]